jgi:hypothetical protein
MESSLRAENNWKKARSAFEESKKKHFCKKWKEERLERSNVVP